MVIFPSWKYSIYIFNEQWNSNRIRFSKDFLLTQLKGIFLENAIILTEKRSQKIEKIEIR